MKAVSLDQISNERAWVDSATICMIIAGLIHLYIAPLHGTHAPAHGWFHLASAVAQLVWGIAFWRKPSQSLMQFGIVLAGSLLTLYAITRFVPAPFTHDVEAVDLYGLVSKTCEALALASLTLLLRNGTTLRASRIPAWRSVALTLFSAVLLGGLTYGVANAAQPLLPWLGEAEVPEVSASVESRATDDNPRWLIGGLAQPFEQGGEIGIAGDVLAKVSINAASGARGRRELDLSLYRGTPANPIDDSLVTALVQMRFMDHGTLKLVALHSDGGHYLLPVQFAMPGEWQVDIVIDTAGKQSTLQLLLDVFD